MVEKMSWSSIPTVLDEEVKIEVKSLPPQSSKAATGPPIAD